MISILFRNRMGKEAVSRAMRAPARRMHLGRLVA
jgi:hypothetical protein